MAITQIKIDSLKSSIPTELELLTAKKADLNDRIINLRVELLDVSKKEAALKSKLETIAELEK